MVKHFFDTSALLNNLEVFENYENIYISNITLKELEDIKTNRNKDEALKYKARQVVKMILEEMSDINFNIVIYDYKWSELFKEFSCLTDNNDSKIIMCALQTRAKEGGDVYFHTSDISCKVLAMSCGLPCEMEEAEEDDYTGFTEMVFDTDDALAHFYSNMKDYAEEVYENEYLVIENKNEEIIDKYRRVGDTLVPVPYKKLKSRTLGDFKPKDVFQEMAVDALVNSQLTLLRGPAGSGKSLLAMSYMFNQLEKGDADRLIIFCNTAPVRDSQELGYYPGSKDEKLLDSQIGNFLIAKLGSRFEVEEMIRKEELLLLPLSDIRGFDVPEKSIVYIQEGQNLTIDHLKLCIQRISENSKLIVDGDDTAQIDLKSASGSYNGMRRCSKVFRGHSEYAEITLQNIYRSKIANIADEM